LAQVLLASGARDEAVAVAERVLEAAPDSIRTWDLLLTATAADFDRGRLFACMERVLAGADGDEAWRPWLLRMRAGLRRHEEPDAALHDLFVAFQQDGDRAFLLRHLELWAADIDAAARARALAALGGEQRSRIEAALAGDGGEQGVLANLRFHLERMLALCRARGIEVYLLTYPEPDPTRDALVAGVAAAAGARFVVVHQRFTELLLTTPRRELFIADGHCTDRGYGVLAAVVAEALR
jgi:hypothetical protein